MSQNKRAQAGTVLPICLLFVFLIAQLAMSAVETAALNQAMVTGLHQVTEVNRLERLAFQQVVIDTSPREGGMEIGFDGADPGVSGVAFRLVYRVQAIDPSSHAAHAVVEHEWCAYRHRAEVTIYRGSDTPVRQSTGHQFHCCADGSNCPDSAFSVWQTGQ